VSAFANDFDDDIGEPIDLVPQLFDLSIGHVASRRSQDLPAAVNGEHDREAVNGRSTRGVRVGGISESCQLQESINPGCGGSPEPEEILLELRSTAIVDEPESGLRRWPSVEESWSLGRRHAGIIKQL
jgi:hypothetical protein